MAAVLSNQAHEMCRRGNVEAAAQIFAALPREFSLVGQACVDANRSRHADPSFASGLTLRAHLAALQTVASVVREIVAPSASWDASATLLLHRCAVTSLELCEPVVSRCGRSALEVAPFLLLVIAATDCAPPFAEASFLGLRVRLCGLACRAFDAAGTSALAYGAGAVPPSDAADIPVALAACAANAVAVEAATAGGWPFADNVSAARELCIRGLRVVAACQRMHLLDAPALDATCAAVDASRAELLIRKFRYDSMVSAQAALAGLQVSEWDDCCMHVQCASFTRTLSCVVSGVGAAQRGIVYGPACVRSSRCPVLGGRVACGSPRVSPPGTRGAPAVAGANRTGDTGGPC